MEALVKSGQLYTPDTFSDIAGTFKQRSGDVVKALCLHVAHTCNLNCSYCFASQGKYHGDRALMSFEVGKQALDFLIQNSGSRNYMCRETFILGIAEMNMINLSFQILQSIINCLITHSQTIEINHSMQVRRIDIFQHLLDTSCIGKYRHQRICRFNRQINTISVRNIGKIRK